MSELEVRIVRLEPVRVAMVNGFGASPESLAWDKMRGWIKEKKLLEDGQNHRFFGFNNPNPSPGSPNYGYDVWVTVDETVQAEGEFKIKDFKGGLYAVTRSTGVENITPNWKKLVSWLEHSPYRHGNHQWLEEHLGPAEELVANEWLVLDLYLPIKE